MFVIFCMKILFAALVAAGVLTGCASSTQLGYGSERKQLMLLSQKMVERQADRAFTKSSGITKKQYLSDHEIHCAKIMNRMIPYADHFIAEDRMIQWGIHLYHSNKTNAGALANGMILMSHKMASHHMLTDDALAYILAHEMAHVLREHHREYKSWKYVISPALLGTTVLTAGTSAFLTGALHDGYGGSSQRLQEKEADLLGLELMAKAGYHPEQAIQVFAKFYPTFLKEYPVLSKLPSFMQRHPSLKKRLAYTEENLDEVMALYQQSSSEQKASKNLISIRPDPRTMVLINGQLIPNVNIASIYKDAQGQLHYELKPTIQPQEIAGTPASIPAPQTTAAKKIL